MTAPSKVLSREELVAEAGAWVNSQHPTSKHYERILDSDAALRAELDAMRAERDAVLHNIGNARIDHAKVVDRLCDERADLENRLDELRKSYRAMRAERDEAIALLREAPDRLAAGRWKTDGAWTKERWDNYTRRRVEFIAKSAAAEGVKDG